MEKIKNINIKEYWLPKFSVNRPVAVLMIYISLLTLSIVSFFRMKLDLFPDITFPTLSVITYYRGAGVQEVEEKLTKLIESNLSIVRNVDKITSISKEGVSIVSFKFKWGTDLDAAGNDIRDRLGFIQRMIPEEADDPMIFRFDFQDMPIIFIGATAEQSYPRLFDILSRDAADMFKKVPGVGNVIVGGAKMRQININVDRLKLNAYNLTLLDVKSALLRNNLTVPSGDIKIGNMNYLLRVPAEYANVSEIGETAVGTFRGGTVKIKDIASVEDAHPEETDAAMINGQPGAMMMIQKRSQANTVEVARGVRKELPNVQKRLPADVKLKVLMDSSEDIEKIISNLRHVLWVAVFLIFGVIMFFLRKITPAFIVFTSIPVSLIDSFMLQYLFGYTINMISMLALTIAVGLVVDDALVVMENQIRHQQELGESPKTAAIFATSEVGRAVTVSTLTSCIVFLPMIFATGIAGILFRQLSVVIVITLLLSLFDSLTLNPTLSSMILKAQEQKKTRGILNRFFAWSEMRVTLIEDFYLKTIRWALEHRKTVILGAFGIFATSLLLIPFVGTEFFPEEDDGKLITTVELPVGTKVEVTHKVMAEIEKKYRKIMPSEWVKDIFWRDGINRVSGSFLAGMGQKVGYHIGSFNSVLVDKEKRKWSLGDVAEKLREEVKKIPGVVRFGSISHQQMFTGIQSPMVVNIYGYDLDKSYALAQKIQSMMEEIKGFKDIAISLDMRSPEYHIILDRPKMSALGLSALDVVNTVNLAFAQQRASIYREMGDEYDIVIRMRDSDRKSERDIEDLFVRTPSGSLVKISNFVKFKKTYGPLQIDREDQQRIIRVTANIYGRDLGSLTRELERKLKKMVLPPQFDISFGGSVKEQRESFQSLGLALVLGILLVYMIIAAQFESLMVPLIIMFSVPFGFVGAIWVFALTGFTLNVGSFIGLILMVGLVVKQAIVYLDYALQIQNQTDDIKLALIEAGRIRLRPILMTVSAMIFGMVPMALSQKQGSEFWQPLSLSVIGGLLASTLVTLVLIPTLYYIWKKR